MNTLPLRHSVPIALALVSVALAVVGIGVERRHSYQQLEAESARRTAALNHVVAGALEASAGPGTSSLRARTLERLADESSVTLALVVGENGRVRESTDPALTGQPLGAAADAEMLALATRGRASTSTQTSLAPDGAWLRVATPFLERGASADAPAGRSVLVTQVDLAGPKRTIYAGILRRSGLFGVAALVACLGVWLYLRRTFTSQLDTLAASVRSYSLAQPAPDVPLGGSRELAEIGAAITQMLSELRAEHARLSESEEKFARIFERAPALVTLSEIETGRFIDVNDQAERLTGYARDEVVGRSSVALGWISAEARARMIDILKRDGRVNGLEMTLRARDGRALECLMFAEVVPIDGQSRLLLICQDLTEYRLAQQARLDSERQFRQLLDKSPLPTCIVRDGTVHYANRALADMHQMPSPESMVGTAFYLYVAPEHRGAARDRAQRRMHAGAAEECFETGGLRADGSRFPVRATVTGVQLSDGPTAIGFFEDISVQRDIETRLRESESRFRQLFEGGADPLFIHDGAGQLVDVNPRACSTLGYTREQLLQKTVFDITPGVPPMHLAAAWEAIDAGRTLTVDGMMARADGTTFPTEVHIVPLDMNGERLFAAAVRDTTHRQVAEQQLRDSEARFRQLFEQAADAIFIHDRAGRVVDANKAGCASLGYTRDELLRMSVEDFEVSVPAGELRRLWNAAHEASGVTVAGLHRRKDGTVVPVEVRASRFEDHGRSLIFAATRDITARLEAEQHVRESEARFRAIVENSHDGIIFTDEFANVTYRSPSYELINGYTADERLGQSAYAVVHQDDLALVSAAWERMFAVPDAFERVEYRIHHKDGSWRWVDSIVRNLLHNANIRSVVVTSRDITERKRAESERERLQTQLSQSQKIEAVGRLAGGVAHDFNNMLSVILGFAEMALDSTEPGQPLREDLLEIQKAAERSGSLTRQLLAFARQQPISPRVVDLNATVQDMLTMLRRLIGENITLAWQPASSLAKVFIDPTQIDQILANLCVNARDAIAGVGTVEIETLNAVIDSDYCATHPGARPGDYVCLAVRDTGCGMSPEVLAHIFEPFYTTKGVGKGTGLGLATVYGVVKQNTGYIDVHSQPGHGSRFTIYLPAQRSAVVRPVAPRVVEPVADGKGTVLLVEDEASVLLLTKRVLEHLGYRVLASTTPRDALRLAAEEGGHIDLLMTDVIMPEMNGRDLAERVLRAWPGIRCLFTSGYTADLIADHGVLDEGVQFLKKPWSKDELAARVHDALAQV